MPTVGFEPTISAAERPQTYALDRAATGTGLHKLLTSVTAGIRRRVNEISAILQFYAA